MRFIFRYTIIEAQSVRYVGAIDPKPLLFVQTFDNMKFYITADDNAPIDDLWDKIVNSAQYGNGVVDLMNYTEKLYVSRMYQSLSFDNIDSAEFLMLVDGIENESMSFRFKAREGDPRGYTMLRARDVDDDMVLDKCYYKTTDGEFVKAGDKIKEYIKKGGNICD